MSEQASIASITAEGVLNEFSYAVPFDANADTGRMRVIYAPNGRGKTNFLRAVSALLTPSLESLQALIEIPIRKLQIDFEGGGSLGLERRDAFEGRFSVRATPSESANLKVELSIDPSDFAGRLYRRVWDEREDYAKYVSLAQKLSPSATLISDDRLSPVLDDTRESLRPDAALLSQRRRSVGTVNRLLERVERMFSQSAFTSLSRESSAGVYAQITRTTLEGSETLSSSEARTALEYQISGLLDSAIGYETYGLFSLRQLRDISSQLTSARQNSAQLPMLHRILKPYLDNVQDQIDALATTLQLVDTFVSGVNKFLDRKELKFTTQHGISLVGRDGTALQPESLSSGERHLLYLMSCSILSTVDRPLVVIDEPELSLGIEWQRDLLPELLRCTESSTVQFLVASHSLQVMNAVPHDEIIQPGESE